MILRLRRGLTQPEAAEQQGVSLWEYRRNEKSVDETLRAKSIGKLSENEVLLIRRTRAKLTRRALAKKLKISEFWLYKMERGQAPLDRLREYWSSK